MNQRHCSRVCCITGVKQAIEVKQAIPDAEVYSFYMDMRMFGPGYEELYRQAQQEFNIHFIRGRISEASQTIDNRVQIKAEDTLIGLPLKMTVDMLVLIVGMKAGACNLQPGAAATASTLYPSGFVKPLDQFAGKRPTRGPRGYLLRRYRSPRRRTSGSRSTKPWPRHTRGGPGRSKSDAMELGIFDQPDARAVDHRPQRHADTRRRLLSRNIRSCRRASRAATVRRPVRPAMLTKFNVRKLQTLVRRGEYRGIREELAKCMLCGKCRLVCPRGINIRQLVLTLKKEVPEK